MKSFQAFRISVGKRLYVIPVFLLFISCDGRNGKSFLPDLAGYNSEDKEVFTLHKQLLEISGISYVSDKELLAINDEDGKLFTLRPGDKKPSSKKFGPDHDYEDLVCRGETYYILESNGNIYEARKSEPAGSRKYEFHQQKKKKIEFESLYAQPGTFDLILLSKEQRLVDDAILAYSFNTLSGQFSEDPVFTISIREVKRLMKDYSTECKPSAAAIHPVLNKLFIIASIGKVLLVCSPDGKVEEVHDLNPDLFAQPEGICFSPAGDMYISNEGLQGKATIIRFPYKP